VTDAMNVQVFKFRNGISKYILKKAGRKNFTKGNQNRPNASFGAPIRSWISNDLRGMTDDLLSESNIRKRGYFFRIRCKKAH
jgi:asparagine synthase (glutamine-hydrolysing)